MKKLKPLVLSLTMVSILFGIYPSALLADVSPLCYRQIQVTFFNSQIVVQALGLQRVDQSLWRFILSDLQGSMWRVPSMVQAEAQSMVPNPLDPPFNNDEAFKILQKVLYRVFYAVMIRNQSKLGNSNINYSSIQGAFRYIWLQQQAVIVNCLYQARSF